MYKVAHFIKSLSKSNLRSIKKQLPEFINITINDGFEKIDEVIETDSFIIGINGTIDCFISCFAEVLYYDLDDAKLIVTDKEDNLLVLTNIERKMLLKLITDRLVVSCSFELGKRIYNNAKKMNPAWY